MLKYTTNEMLSAASTADQILEDDVEIDAEILLDDSSSLLLLTVFWSQRLFEYLGLYVR